MKNKKANSQIKKPEFDKKLLFEMFIHLNSTRNELQKRYEKCSYDELEILKNRGFKLMEEAKRNGVKSCYYDRDELAVYSVMLYLEYDFTYHPSFSKHTKNLDSQITGAKKEHLQGTKKVDKKPMKGVRL